MTPPSSQVDRLEVPLVAAGAVPPLPFAGGAPAGVRHRPAWHGHRVPGLAVPPRPARPRLSESSVSASCRMLWVVMKRVDLADERRELVVVLERRRVVVGDRADDARSRAAPCCSSTVALRPSRAHAPRRVARRRATTCRPRARPGADLLVHEDPLEDEVELRVDQRGDDVRHARAVGREVVLQVLDGLHDVLA